MPESATMPRSCSQSVQAGPRASRISDRARVRPLRLGALVGDAVVADHRRREADELLRVARVGDDLLVAGHRGREDRLAEREALGGRRTRRERPFRPRARGSRVIPRTPCVRRRPSRAPCRAASRRAATSSPSASGSRPPRRASSRSGRAGRGSPARRPRSRGSSRPYARAGPADIRSSSVSSGITPGSTSCV